MKAFPIEEVVMGQRFFWLGENNEYEGVLFKKTDTVVDFKEIIVLINLINSLPKYVRVTIDKNQIPILNATTQNQPPSKIILEGQHIFIPPESIVRILDNDLTPEQVEDKI